MTIPIPTPEALRDAFGHFPSGVVAVCGKGPDGPVGMAASTFVPVSLDPPLVLVCLQTTSRTWAQLRELPRLGISVLAEDHDRIARTLAARDGDRFDGVGFVTGPTGSVRIAGSSAYFDCSLEQESPAGDHLLAVLRVHLSVTADDNGPLVFHRSRFGRLSAPAATSST